MSWFFVCGLIGSGLVGPNRMAIRQQYDLSETHFGLALAGIQITTSTAVLLMSHLLARLKPITILMLALSLVALGFMYISFSNQAISLVIGWAMSTAGLTMGMITNNISMDLWPANPRRGIVLLHSFNAGGKVAGPLVAIVFLSIGYRYSFTAVGVLALLMLIATWLWRHKASEVELSEAVDPASGLNALRKGEFWIFMLLIGMIAGGEVAFATLLPTFLQTDRAMTGEMANAMLTIHLVGLTIGRFASAYMGDKVSGNTVISVCLASGAMVFPAMLIDNTIVIAFSLLVMGAMFSSTWPSYYAIAAERLKNFRHMLPYGSAIGCFVVSSTCVLISSVIADYSLIAAMFFGPAVLWVFGLLHIADSRRVARRSRLAG